MGEYFEEYISANISSGKYNSASEVIRTALKLLESEELKTNDLNKVLLQGKKSGMKKNFNSKEKFKEVT